MKYNCRQSGLWLPDNRLHFPEVRGFAQPRYNFLPGHFPGGAVAKAAGGPTTINLAISATEDDVDDQAFAGMTDGDAVIAGAFSGFEATAGFRFQNVTVPQGATIESATLTVEVVDTEGSPDVDVFGVAEDNAAVWNDPDNIPSDTTQTSVSTNITPGSTGSLSIDVAAQVQEIINRAGWSSGNALALTIFDNAGGTNNVDMEALNAGNGNEATLDITYS